MMAPLTSNVVLEYPIVSSPPMIQSLSCKVINIQGTYDVDANPIIELSSGRVLYHEKVGNLVFLLPCSSSLPSLVPFELIHRVVDTLEKYFSPPLIAVKIENHYDTVSQILSEMVANGLPYITEPDAIQDLVPYGGILSKILAGSSSKTVTVSNIPWRRANVRHTNNELFVDMVEKLHVVVRGSRSIGGGSQWQSSSAYYSNSSSSLGGTNALRKNAGAGSGSLTKYTKPLIIRSEGAIFITSHLSGTPEIQLSLNLPQKIASPSFHPGVNISKWRENPGTLFLIPPDGKSLLASYTIDISNQGIVLADLQTGLGVNKDEFEVKVWTQMARDVKYVEGLVINLICDNMSVRTVQGLRVTSGDFHLNESGVAEWRFAGRTPLGWNASVRGVLVKANDSDDDERQDPVFPTYLTMSYSLTGQVPSGIKVTSLKIVSNRGMAEGVKPYKGVRYMTTGDFTVR